MKNIFLKSTMIGFAFSTLVSHASVGLGPNTTITFEPGKAALTHDAQNRLRDLVNQARQNGKIDEIKVAVWSDNPAPREGEELSKLDRDLAESRAKAIHQSLKRLSVSDVETYNMAERASWLSRVFHTESAELKSELGRNNESPMFKEEFQIFKNNGDSSKAVVVAIVKYHR